MSWNVEDTDLGGYDVPNSVPDRSAEAVVDVIDDLNDQLIQNTEHALDAQMHEAYNRGYIDGIEWAFDQDLGDNIDKHFPNGVIGEGSYKSPMINVGTNPPEVNQGRYKSPVINVDPDSYSQSNTGIDSSIIPDSWDEYSLGGDLSQFEFSGEPESDSPGKYLESRGVELGEGQTDGSVSINVSYDGAGEDDLTFLNSAS